ncbi:hypothetical protein DFQ29_008882 [Apophysomyces sp. BC1021]|nr:hypothetical protein DFQ29_008882 [Apophysomyces sp. BC1021]
MIGPSIQVLIELGARFPPCMRNVTTMPPTDRYILACSILQLTSPIPEAPVLLPIFAAWADSKTQINPSGS